MLQISYHLTLACPVYVVLAQYYDYEHISTVHPQTLGEYRLVEVRDAGCDVIYDQLDNRCPHAGGPLALGRVTADGLCVECPWHGARFQLATGKHMGGPGQADVQVVDLLPHAGEQASPTPTNAGGFP